MVAITSLIASSICGPSDIIQETILRLGEVPILRGITLGEEPLIVYGNPITKTFSVVIRRADGISCLITGGIDYIVTMKGIGL